MDFGLGLVLSFTDNATAGINNAVNSLNQLTQTAESANSSMNQMASLSALSIVADRMGSSFINAGGTILSTLGQVIGKVNETGQTLMFAENQLGKLYEGSGKTGIDVLNDISNYAKKSIFNFEDLIPVVTMLKANGIEAFDSIASSTGKANQTLMDYAADLAAFNPQMRNTYGTGIKAAMGALNEYIAEGNARSLKAGASLDITALLGEDKGKTIEERSRQVADLMEKLGMVGMTAQMAGTPVQKLSNMGDVLFSFISKISDSGVYDEFNNIITKLADYVFAIPDEELDAIAKSVGEGLVAVMKPLEYVVEGVLKLVDGFRNLLKEHPGLSKFIISLTAVVGVGLVVSGVVLKVVSSIGMLTIGLKSFSGSFQAISSLFSAGAKRMLGSMLPLMLAVGLFAAIWKSDFAGIRTTVTGFVENIQTSFDTAKQAVNGSLTDMQNTLNGLDTENNFFDGLSLSIMKLMTVGRALSEGWNNFELSEDTYLKAKELGILPLIEALFDLKYRFDNFKKGFIEGWNTVSNFVKGVFAKMKGAVGGSVFDKLFSGAEKFFNLLSDNDPEAWSKVGKVIGEIVAVVAPLIVAFKLLNKVAPAGGILSSVFGGGGASSASGGAVGGGVLQNPAKVLKTMGSLALIIGGTIAVIEAIGLMSQNPYFNLFLTSGVKTLAQLAGAIGSVALIAVPLGLMVTAFSKLGVSPKEALKGMGDIAILLGGLDVLIIAVGALNSIPGFDDFISNGVSSLARLGSAMKDVAILSIVLGAVATIFAKLHVTPKDAALGIANVAILIGGLDVLIIALGALNSIPGFTGFLNTGAETMSKVVDTLAGMFNLKFIAMCGLIAAFGLVPVQVVALGLANLAILLGGVSLLIVAFGALSKIPGFNDFIQTGGDTLALLFSQIGKIAGSVIGGFAEGVMSSLPQIGNDLGAFGQNVKPLFTSLQGAPLNEMGAFGSAIASMLLKLSVEKLLSFFTGEVDLVKIGNQLAQFGVAVKPFFESMAEVSEIGLERAPKVIEMICSIGGYGIQFGGLAQLFTGETRLDKIGEQLASFAPNGATFFNTVGTYSEAGLEKAPKVFEAIAGVGDFDFKSGGLAQLFTGETRIDNIGEQLAAFAPNGTTFFNAVGGYSDSGLTKAPKVFEAIVGIGDFDFKSGGIAQLFTGSTDLEDIGEQLSEFGESAKGFFDIASQISETGLRNGDRMIEAVNNLSQFKSGGFVELFEGSIDLLDVGDQLSEFAPKVKGFFDTAALISEDGLWKGRSIFSALSQIGNSEFRSGGIVQFFTGDVSLASIGTDLSDFATNAKSFFDIAAKLDQKGFTNATQMFTSLTNSGNIVDIAVKSTGSLESFGKELVTFAGDMKTFVDKAGSLGDMGGVDKFLSSLTDIATKITELKGTVGTSTSDIVSSLGKMTNKFNTTANSVNKNVVSMKTTMSTEYATMVSTTNTSFTNMVNTIRTKMNSAVSEVTSGVSRLKSALNFQWSLPNLKLPHITVSGKFNVDPPEAPKFSVNWYEKGGVFDKPSIIGVGEAGTEAVMPLQNNTEWIGTLATMIASHIQSVQANNVTPVPVLPQMEAQNEVGGNQYMTTNNSQQTTTHTGNTDNSITFEQGAIQINVAKATEDDAVKLAKKIMEIIKRQKELQTMLNYG